MYFFVYLFLGLSKAWTIGIKVIKCNRNTDAHTCA